MMKSQEIFLTRRKKFLEKMGSGMAVLFAAPHAKRNYDVHYEYRTCSNFYYLTGFPEQDAAAIFLPGSDKPYKLFVHPKDPEKEMWEGKRAGVEASKSLFAADETYSIHEFNEVFKKLLKQVDTLYFGLGEFPEQDNQILEMVKNHHPNSRTGDKIFRNIRKVQELVTNMRWKKDAEEVATMRKAAEISSMAHRKAMETARPGMYEYEIEAEIEYWFRKGGAEDLAYASIVAGGNNATVLHYKTNRDSLKDGTLLLIDAGSELENYASDITRTFPVSGKFTKAQRALYEIVLRANKEAIAIVKPGLPFAEIHKRATEVLVDGLLDLGLLKGSRAEIVKDRKNYANFYPHGTSHWLGLDVHDPSAYTDDKGNSLPIEEGNVFTIEPGLYIGEDRMDVPAEYRGIGIRIEDDILVTATGADVLTKNCPKEIAEIESIVGTGSAN